MQSQENLSGLHSESQGAHSSRFVPGVLPMLTLEDPLLGMLFGTRQWATLGNQSNGNG